MGSQLSKWPLIKINVHFAKLQILALKFNIQYVLHLMKNKVCEIQYSQHWNDTTIKLKEKNIFQKEIKL